MKNKLSIAVAGLIAVIVFLLVLATPKLEPHPPLPVPNGYDDFVKAGTMIEQNPPDWWSLSGDEKREALKILTATNHAALELIRVGLTKEWQMPGWKSDGTNWPHLLELTQAKQIAQAFSAESKLALLEGKTNQAGLVAMECIRFGNEWVRGGVLIDGLVGIAVKNIGLSDLKATIDGLDIEVTRNTISALSEIESRSESGDVVLRRERQWARRGQFGRMGPVDYLRYLVEPIWDQKSRAKTRQKFDRVNIDILRMQIQLAAHAFELEQGKPATSARELVPRYLKSVPLDPATGAELPLN